MTLSWSQAARLAVAALAAAGALACGPAPPVQRPADETLVLAVRADVTGIFPNPPIVNEAFTSELNRNVFQALVRLDGGLRLVPDLATNWTTPSPDTYVFELPAGLRFSDGRPLSAQDVAASIEAGRQWVYRENFHSLAAARALDDRRVEIRTSVSFPVLLTRLPWGLVLPRDAIGQRPVPAVGSGPYRLESREPGRAIVLLRNPHYSGARPAYERVRYEIQPDDDARVQAVLSGQAQAADQVPLRRLAELAGRPEARLISRAGLRVLYLSLRLDRAPFADPRVREAVDLALDRDELVRRALDGHGQSASQIVPPSIVGHDPHRRVTRRDLPRARALLAAAGHSRGLDLRLDGPNNRYVNDTAILAEVARQLGEAGLRVTVNALDKAEYFALTASGGSSFWLEGWSCEAGDAGDALDSLAHSRDGRGYGDANDVALADAELDALIEQANASRAAGPRTERLRLALDRLAALRAYLPLHVQHESVLVSRRVAWDPPLLVNLVPAEMRPAVAPGP